MTGLSICIPRGRGGAEPVTDGGTFWGERLEAYTGWTGAGAGYATI